MAAKDARSRRGGGRGLGIGLLAVLVALLVAYLGKCLPGFGVGGSSSSSSSSPGETAPAKADPKAADSQDAEAIELTVNGEDCRRGAEPPKPCPDLCRALAAEAEPAKARPVIVHAALGTHAAVETLRTCLTEAGFANVVVRTQ